MDLHCSVEHAVCTSDYSLEMNCSLREAPSLMPMDGRSVSAALPSLRMTH